MHPHFHAGQVDAQTRCATVSEPRCAFDTACLSLNSFGCSRTLPSRFTDGSAASTLSAVRIALDLTRPRGHLTAWPAGSSGKRPSATHPTPIPAGVLRDAGVSGPRRTPPRFGRAPHARIPRGPAGRAGGTRARRAGARLPRRPAGRARGAPLLFIECRAPAGVLLSRIRERQLDPERISDADAAVVRRQLAEVEPREEITAQARAELVTEARPEESVTTVEEIVDARIWRDPAGRADSRTDPGQ